MINLNNIKFKYPKKDSFALDDISSNVEGSCVSWKYNLIPMLTMMKRAKERNLLAVKGRDKKEDDTELKEKGVA